MPGQPVTAAQLARYDENEERIFEQIADGEPMGDVARRFGGSRTILYKWVGATPERKARLAEVRKQRAEAHAERGLDELERLSNGPVYPAEVALAGHKAGYHKWLAAKMDPDTYGEQKQQANVNVNLNVGELHLNALKAAGGQALAGPVVEAEVIQGPEAAAALPAGDQGDELALPS